MSDEFELATSWYALDSSDGDGPPYTISGVALPPDTTAFSDGENVHFSAGELRESADSLEGMSITEGHPSDYPYPVSDTIGRITKATYDEQLGVVYEGVVSDSEIATKIDSGALDVSAHVMSNDGGTTESGAVNAVDLSLLGLALVSQGAAEGNSVESGPLSIDTPTPQADGDVQSQVALALDSSESNGDVETFTPGVAREIYPDDGLESLRTRSESESTTETSGGDDSSGGVESTDDPADEPASDDVSDRLDEATESMDDVDARIEALEGDVQDRLSAKDDRIEELEEKLTRKNQYIATLEDAGEAVMSVDDEMREMLSSELAEGAPMGSGELFERFDVTELWSMYQDSDRVGTSRSTHTASPPEPDVQSGAQSGGRVSALSSEEKQRASELRESIDNLRGKTNTRLTESMIERRQEELEALTGEENYTGT